MRVCKSQLLSGKDRGRRLMTWPCRNTSTCMVLLIPEKSTFPQEIHFSKPEFRNLFQTWGLHKIHKNCLVASHRSLGHPWWSKNPSTSNDSWSPCQPMQCLHIHPSKSNHPGQDKQSGPRSLYNDLCGAARSQHFELGTTFHCARDHLPYGQTHDMSKQHFCTQDAAPQF